MALFLWLITLIPSCILLFKNPPTFLLVPTSMRRTVLCSSPSAQVFHTLYLWSRRHYCNKSPQAYFYLCPLFPSFKHCSGVSVSSPLHSHTQTTKEVCSVVFTTCLQQNVVVPTIVVVKEAKKERSNIGIREGIFGTPIRIWSLRLAAVISNCPYFYMVY